MAALEAFGWGEPFASAFATLADGELLPGRVIVEHGPVLTVATEQREVQATASGKLRHEASSAAELPTIGDWVLVRGPLSSSGAHIQAVLPRRTKISRNIPGDRRGEQVLAANVDAAVLMMGLDRDFNPRRLERYLALAYTSNTRPIIMLTKADLCEDLEEYVAELRELVKDAPLLTVSLLEPNAAREVVEQLAPAQTHVLLGSSGVGKSTLLNALVGRKAQKTGTVRASDSRGRHTTTHRQLFALENGALVIDTPGLRELQLWDAEEGLETAFADIEAFAENCKFRDCKHVDEPQCGVLDAFERGEISEPRLRSYFKLRDELEAARTKKRR
jgi:ribosome biogenesis GTPase / thiamine phosphate phosphatase